MDSSQEKRIEALNEALDEALGVAADRATDGKVDGSESAGAPEETSGHFAADGREASRAPGASGGVDEDGARVNGRPSRPDPELAELLAAAERVRGYRPRPRAAFDARMRRAIDGWPASAGMPAADAPAEVDRQDEANRGDGTSTERATESRVPDAPAARVSRGAQDTAQGAPAWPRVARRLALRTAGVAAAVALTFGGLRAVSADSSPGDLLWPLRRAVQGVERVVTEAAAGLPAVLGVSERMPRAEEGAGGDAPPLPTATAVARRGAQGAGVRGDGSDRRSDAARREEAGARATESATRRDAVALAAAAATADSAATRAALTALPGAAVGTPTVVGDLVTGAAGASPTPTGAVEDPRNEDEPRGAGGGSGGDAGSGSGGGSGGGSGSGRGSAGAGAQETPTATTTPSPMPSATIVRTPVPAPSSTATGTPDTGAPSATPDPSSACRGQIAGRILLPDGSPVPEALVLAIPGFLSQPPTTPVPEPDPNEPEPVVSSPDGTYRIGRLCVGEYLVAAMLASPTGRLQGVHDSPFVRLERADSIVVDIDIVLRPEPTPEPSPGAGPTRPATGGHPPGAATATASATATSAASATPTTAAATSTAGAAASATVSATVSATAAGSGNATPTP